VVPTEKYDRKVRIPRHGGGNILNRFADGINGVNTGTAPAGDFGGL